MLWFYINNRKEKNQTLSKRETRLTSTALEPQENKTYKIYLLLGIIQIVEIELDTVGIAGLEKNG